MCKLRNVRMVISTFSRAKNSVFLIFEDGADRLCRNVGRELTTMRCAVCSVFCQKTADRICFATEGSLESRQVCLWLVCAHCCVGMFTLLCWYVHIVVLVCAHCCVGMCTLLCWYVHTVVLVCAHCCAECRWTLIFGPPVVMQKLSFRGLVQHRSVDGMSVLAVKRLVETDGPGHCNKTVVTDWVIAIRLW
jgi:hypothetical protein